MSCESETDEANLFFKKLQGCIDGKYGGFRSKYIRPSAISVEEPNKFEDFKYR